MLSVNGRVIEIASAPYSHSREKVRIQREKLWISVKKIIGKRMCEHRKMISIVQIVMNKENALNISVTKSMGRKLNIQEGLA